MAARSECRVRSVRHVAPCDPAYPPALRGLPQMPARLWMRGAPGALVARPAVAIVGARAASDAGRAIAWRLAWELAEAGIVIVSGLALGIDGAAHRGALSAGGLTVAVLACGLDCCFPREHAPLAREIAVRGALVSEWRPGTPAVAWRFPRRNRLISGLAHVVVVVEGGAKSGVWHTVRYGLAQGREVMAVPRDPIAPGSCLPNRLLRDGAAPAVTSADVLAALPAWATSAAAADGPPRADCAAGERPARGCPGGRTGARAAKGGARPTLPGVATLSSPSAPLPASVAAGPFAASASSVQSASSAAPASTTAPARRRLETVLRRQPPARFEQLAAALPDLAPGQLQALVARFEIEGRLRRDGCGRLRWEAG